MANFLDALRQTQETARPVENQEDRWAGLKQQAQEVETRTAYSANERDAYNRLTSDQWWVGDKPTRAQLEATIWTRTKDDPVTRKAAFADADKLYSKMGSGYTDLYSGATSDFLKTLQKNGFDVSNVDDAFFAKYEDFVQKNLERSTTTGNAKSSTKSTSKDGWSAYALVGAKKEWETTKTARSELDALNKEVQYWVGKGLSDKEIRDKIYDADGNFNSKSYKTLQKMESSFHDGNVVKTTGSVGYNSDTLTGMIWAARNGDSSGDYNNAAVRYYLGQGKGEPTDRNAVNQRTFGHKDYNPWVHGNMDDEFRVLGIHEATPEWMATEGEKILQENDPAKVAALKSINDKMGNANKASEEVGLFSRMLNNRARTYTPSTDGDPVTWATKVVDGMLATGDFPTMVKMDDARKWGGKFEMPYGVNYRREDMISALADQVTQHRSTVDAMEAIHNKRMAGIRAQQEAAAAAAQEAQEKLDSVKAPGRHTVKADPGLLSSPTDIQMPKKAAGTTVSEQSQAGLMQAAEKGEVNLTDFSSIYNWFKGNDQPATEHAVAEAVQEAVEEVTGQKHDKFVKPAKPYERPERQVSERAPAQQEEAKPAVMRDIDAAMAAWQERHQDQQMAGAQAMLADIKAEFSKYDIDLTEAQAQQLIDAVMGKTEEKFGPRVELSPEYVVNTTMGAAPAAAPTEPTIDKAIADKEIDGGNIQTVTTWVAIAEGNPQMANADEAYGLFKDAWTGLLKGYATDPNNTEMMVGDYFDSDPRLQQVIRSWQMVGYMGLDDMNAQGSANFSMRSTFGAAAFDTMNKIVAGGSNTDERAEMLAILGASVIGAQQKGMSTSEYLEAYFGDELQAINKGIDDRMALQQQQAQAAAEQQKADNLNYAQAVVGLVSQVGVEGLTEDQKKVYDYIHNPNDAVRLEAQDDPTFLRKMDELDAATGIMDAWGGSNGFEIMKEAQSILEGDYALAKQAGMTMDELYAAAPSMNMTPEQLMTAARAQYNQKWELGEQAKAQTYGEGIGDPWKLLGMMAQTATVETGSQYTGFAENFLRQEDWQVLQENKTYFTSKYGAANASHAQYEATMYLINNTVDPELKAKRQAMVDEALKNGTDIAMLPLQYGIADFENATAALEKIATDNREYIAKNGTKLERDLFNTGAGMIGSAEQFSVQMLLSTIMPVGAASLLTYFEGAFNQGYEAGEAAGLTEQGKKSLGMATGIVTTVMETEAAEKIYLPKTDILTDGMKASITSSVMTGGKSKARDLAGKALMLGVDLIGNGIEESAQELTEGWVNGAIMSIATQDPTHFLDSIDPEKMSETAYAAFMSSLLMSVESKAIQGGTNAFNLAMQAREAQRDRAMIDGIWNDILATTVPEELAEEAAYQPTVESPIPAAATIDAAPVSLEEAENNRRIAEEKNQQLEGMDEGIEAGQQVGDDAFNVKPEEQEQPGASVAEEQPGAPVAEEQPAAPVAEEQPKAPEKPALKDVKSEEGQSFLKSFAPKAAELFATLKTEKNATKRAQNITAFAQYMDGVVKELAGMSNGRGSLVGRDVDYNHRGYHYFRLQAQRFGIAVTQYRELELSGKLTPAAKQSINNEIKLVNEAIANGYKAVYDLVNRNIVKTGDASAPATKQAAAKAAGKTAAQIVANSPEVQGKITEAAAASSVAQAVQMGALNTDEVGKLQKAEADAKDVLTKASTAARTAKAAVTKLQNSYAAAVEAAQANRADEAAQKKSVEIAAKLSAAKARLEEANGKKAEAQKAYDTAKAATKAAKDSLLAAERDRAKREADEGMRANVAAVRMDEARTKSAAELATTKANIDGQNVEQLDEFIKTLEGNIATAEKNKIGESADYLEGYGEDGMGTPNYSKLSYNNNVQALEYAKAAREKLTEKEKAEAPANGLKDTGASHVTSKDGAGYHKFADLDGFKKEATEMLVTKGKSKTQRVNEGDSLTLIYADGTSKTFDEGQAVPAAAWKNVVSAEMNGGDDQLVFGEKYALYKDEFGAMTYSEDDMGEGWRKLSDEEIAELESQSDPAGAEENNGPVMREDIEAKRNEVEDLKDQIAELQSKGSREGGLSQDDMAALNKARLDLQQAETDLKKMEGSYVDPMSETDEGGADYFVGGNTPGNQGPIKTKDGKVEHSPLQILKQLASDLSIGLHPADKKMGTRKSVAGYYRTQHDSISIRSNRTQQLRVTMHEVGHAIQARTGFGPTQQMEDDCWNNFGKARGYTRAQMNHEAMAEFTMSYMTDPNGAVVKFGATYVNQFEDALRKAGIYDQVQKARDDIEAYNNADYMEQLGAHIVNSPFQAKKSLSETAANWARRFMVHEVDDTFAARRLDNQIMKASGGKKTWTLQNALRMGKFSDRVAENIITSELTDKSGRHIAEGLADTIGLKDTKSLDMLSTYLVCQQALDRAQHMIDQMTADGKSPDEIQAALDNHEYQDVFGKDVDIGMIKDAVDAMPQEIKDAANRFYDWWGKFMKTWMVDTRLIGRDEFRELRTQWPRYAPLMRDVSNPGSNTKNGSNYNFGLKAITKEGSDLDVINPLSSIQTIIGETVKAARQNEAMNVLYGYLATKGNDLGEYVREVPGDFKTDTVGSDAVIDKLKKNGINQAALPMISALLGSSISQVRRTQSVADSKVVGFTDALGKKHFLEFWDQELLDAVVDNSSKPFPVLDKIAKVTREMASLTTAKNPLFTFTNALRDFQTSVNHGSWATSYADGGMKWVQALVEVATGSNYVNQYMALGGGDFARIGKAMTAKEGTEMLRRLSDKYERDGMAGVIHDVVSFLPSKVEDINGLIETTSRFVEYRFGQHDLTTDQGRYEAFLAAQDATVDFARSGNGSAAKLLRSVIPFWNATLQGTYRAIDTFGVQQRDRLPARAAKTLVNNAILGAISALAPSMFGDKDDEDAYNTIAQDIRTSYFILPMFNIKDQERRFFRMPLAQDPWSRVGYAIGNQACSVGMGNGLSLDLMRLAAGITEDFMQDQPILSSAAQVLFNKDNWNKTLVPTRMKDMSVTQRANDSTPGIYVWASRALSAMGIENDLTSPIALEYLTKQNTGVIGQFLTPIVSGDAYDNYKVTPYSIGMNLWNTLVNRFTIDPAYSNNVSDAYYDGKGFLDRVNADIKNAGSSDAIKAGMGQEAIDRIKYLTGTNGEITRIDKEIADLYAEMEKNTADLDMTRHEKVVANRKLKDQIVAKQAEGAGIVGQFKKDYAVGNNPYERWVNYGKDENVKASPYAKYGEVFSDEKDQWYYGVSESRYGAGTTSAMPNPAASFQQSKVTYKVSEMTQEERDKYYSDYGKARREYLSTYKGELEKMTPEEQDKVLKAANTYGNKAAKDGYLMNLKTK